ncbi:MAG: hypothetical protein SOZ52_02175 [Pyramidobacter sp.]|nr:hypothetical protein [Pyramidobacter sp.]
MKANNATATANATANATATDESATDESNESNANATDESKQQATEPTAEQIAAAKVEQKHQTEIANRYTLDAPKEVERTKFAGAHVLGVWRVDKTKHTKKDGDKTFFKIYYRGTIYDGFTATEFCDEIGIERKHRAGTTKKESTLLDKLQALKAAIEAVASTESDFVNFAKIVAKKIESEKLESDRTAFVAKYAAAIALFAEISEATCAKIYGDDVLALALKLGYKFADTKATTESK